jgi:hypothetical protein
VSAKALARFPHLFWALIAQGQTVPSAVRVMRDG